MKNIHRWFLVYYPFDLYDILSLQLVLFLLCKRLHRGGYGGCPSVFPVSPPTSELSRFPATLSLPRCCPTAFRFSSPVFRLLSSSSVSDSSPRTGQEVR